MTRIERIESESVMVTHEGLGVSFLIPLKMRELKRLKDSESFRGYTEETAEKIYANLLKYQTVYYDQRSGKLIRKKPLGLPEVGVSPPVLEKEDARAAAALELVGETFEELKKA